MPISSHLLRKLQDTLGTDATSDLANILDTVDTLRADVAELRHTVELIKVRLDATATRADIQELRTEMQTMRGELRTDMQAMRGDLGVAFERGLRAQTRWMLAMLATFLVAVYFRG